MTNRVSACVAAIVFSLCAAPAFAQATGDVIERIDAQGLRALVTSLGHQITNEAATDEGQPFVTASTGSLNYMVAGTACADGQCQGMLTELLFANTPATLETANEVNQTYAAIKMVILDDGSVVFSRYDVLNGGTTLGALASSVSTLLDITEVFVDTDAD